MMITTSKYKTFGLLLLSFLNIIWLPITYKILLNIRNKMSDVSYRWETIDFTISGFVIFIQVLFLFRLMKECRLIIIDNEKITFVNPILPFLRKTKFFNDYDYKQVVQEYSRGGYYEAVWLIKDGKLKDRISSFYYSNYSEIRDRIKVKNKGRLKINKFKQFGCLLGMKI